MSKTTITKLITGTILFFLVVCASTNKGYSQFLGLYSYIYENDSTTNGNICLNDTLTGYIGWSHTGSYIPGDNVDFLVDWGDGVVDPYTNTPILDAGGYGVIDSSIILSHTYTLSGSYSVIISSLDNYSNADADTFYFTASNLCGDIQIGTYLDNGDGLWGSGDILLPAVDLLLTSSGPSYYTTTNSWGWNYMTNIDITASPYVLEVDPFWLSATGMTTVQPVSTNYNIPTVSGATPGFYFLLDCGSSTYFDAAIDGWGWGFRAGMSTGYTYLSIHNTSCNAGPASTDISLDFDPMLTVYSSSLPGGTITSGNISWSGTSIPFGWSTVLVYFTVPPGTPALTPLAFQADITPTSATDLYPSNNTAIFHSEVRNSWDPNDKSTNVEHFIDVNTQEDIQYTVRFQNMGNDDAFDIHIVDTISALLDLSTFKVLSQSHDGSYSINPTTREVIFTFPNINLVPQSVDELLSQGFITYTIKENAGLALNSDIHNTAHIFFDGNAAVVTNTTSNVNIANVGIEESPLNAVTVYPIPANTYVQISGINPQDITSLKIYDLNGKVVQIINQTVTSSYVQVSEIPNGFYLLEIYSGMNSIVRKICIQH